jgi:cilia- and flagella-associated protein 251
MPSFQSHLKVNPWDPNEIMTYSNDSVFFGIVDSEWKGIEMHEPEMDMTEFNLESVGFSCAVFISTSGQACVGTVHGDLMILANRSLSNLGTVLPPGKKSIIKIFRIHNGPVTALSSFKKRLISGGQDGCIKVFDLQCRLLFWYNQFHSGGITAILPSPFGELLYPEGIPELTVSTEHSRLFLLSRQEGSIIPFRPSTASTGTESSMLCPAEEDKRVDSPLCHTILDGIFGRISKMDVNPIHPRLLIGTTKGQLQLWDLSQKTIITSRTFVEKNKGKKKVTPMAITCLEFSKTGKSVGVGFENGVVEFLEAGTLVTIHSDKSSSMGHQVSHCSITHISFSQDGLWCACADNDNVTILFKKEQIKIEGGDNGDVRKPRVRIEWVFIGRRKTHYKPIVSVLFHQSRPSEVEECSQRLLIVSKDRHVSELDLNECTTGNGIKVKYVRRLEQLYQPETAVMWTTQSDNYLLTFTTGSKFRLFQSETQVCKSTTLGPSFGSIIHTLVLLADNKTICFGTDRVSTIDVDVGTRNVTTRWKPIPIYWYSCPPYENHWVGADTPRSGELCGRR